MESGANLTLNKANVLSSIAAYVANQSCFKNISLTIYFLKRNSGTQAAKIKKKKIKIRAWKTISQRHVRVRVWQSKSS